MPHSRFMNVFIRGWLVCPSATAGADQADSTAPLTIKSVSGHVYHPEITRSEAGCFPNRASERANYKYFMRLSLWRLRYFVTP